MLTLLLLWLKPEQVPSTVGTLVESVEPFATCHDGSKFLREADVRS